MTYYTNTKSSTSPSTPAGQSYSVSVTVDLPNLTRVDPESICRFLNLYDQYAQEVIARSKELDMNVLGTEAARPIDLKYFVNMKYT